MLWCIFYIEEFFYGKKIIITNSRGLSKFLKLIVFGQILTKFGSFGQFWADSTAMVVAKSMALIEKKKIIRKKFCKMFQNLMYNGFLEGPLNLPSTQKVSKHLIRNWNCCGMPKMPKFHIWNS
jgi:hypothetical protein